MPKLPDGLHYGDKYDIYQEIDISKHFGVDLSDNSSLANQIGQAIIDKMIKRTGEGKDIWNRPLDKYSKDYIESNEFQDADKSPSDINMTLTGDMLSDIDILSFRGNKLTIGFNESVNQKKAANHSNGVTVPKRFFFGITGSELDDIKRMFSDDLKQFKKTRETTQEQDERASLLELFERRNQTPRQVFSDIFGDRLFNGFENNGQG